MKPCCPAWCLAAAVLIFGAVDGRPLRQGIVHAFATAPKYQEYLSHVDSTLPDISQPKLNQIVFPGSGVAPAAGFLSLPANVRLSQRNTPALFGAGLIDRIP